MTITINGSGTITGATTLATTVASPTLTTPNIDSAQIPTVSGTAPLYMCRAWVNFDGTGTPAIRASGNVTSITDQGVGDYTLNLTTALPDINYSVAGFVNENGRIVTGRGVAFTTSAIRIGCFIATNQTQEDQSVICAAIFR
jgi:hypothetical protein